MKIPYHNETHHYVHIGPITIAPGQTRDVEESHIPGYKAKEEAPADETDPFAVLLGHNVKTVVEALPAMSVEEVEKLGEMEQKGQNRKGVLAAVAEALLSRAGNPPAPAGEGAPAPAGEGAKE